MGGAESIRFVAPSTVAGGSLSVATAGSVTAASKVSAALRRIDRSSRCTVECCFPPNVAGSTLASRPTIASAVMSGSAASQPPIVARCGSSFEGTQKSWRRLDGHNQLPKLILGVKFADGLEVRHGDPSARDRRRLTGPAVTNNWR